MYFIRKSFLWLSCATFVFIMSCDKDDDQLPPSPAAPVVTLIAPANEANGVDINPTFSWEATSVNSDELMYDFHIGEDSTNMIVQGRNLSATEFRLTDFKLKKGVNYLWNVVADDGTTTGSSAIWTFLSIPAPDKAVLLGPEENSYVRTIATLSWEPVEAGEGEVLTYEVFVGSTNPPEEKIAEIEETSYDFDTSELNIAETYYWMVKVSDKINRSESEVKSFIKLRPGSPDEPMLVGPLNREGIKADTALLEWTAVEDPEGDAVSYNVYLDQMPNPTTLVATVTTNSYTTEILDKDTAYYWRVEAVDPSNNFTGSPTTQSFQLLNDGGPDSPLVKDLATDGVLSLDESLKWEPATGAVSYDVYIDNVSPPQNIVLENTTETEYLVPLSVTPSTLLNVVTYYAQIVAKDSDGVETRSLELAFTPQVTGTVTDVRGPETEMYNWVRVNDQVWMSQGLRTKRLTDGTELVNIGGGALNRANAAFDEMPASLLGTNGLPNMSQQEWVAKNGRVYNHVALNNTRLAPEGWHLVSRSDVDKLVGFVIEDQGNPNGLTGNARTKIAVEAITSPLYNGTDLYGIGIESAGWRSGDDWNGRAGILIQRNFHKLQEEGDFLELRNQPGSNEDGWVRMFSWGAFEEQMAPALLVKD